MRSILPAHLSLCPAASLSPSQAGWASSNRYLKPQIRWRLAGEPDGVWMRGLCSWMEYIHTCQAAGDCIFTEQTTGCYHTHASAVGYKHTNYPIKICQPPQISPANICLGLPYTIRLPRYIAHRGNVFSTGLMSQLCGIVTGLFWMRLCGVTAASSKWKSTYEFSAGLPALWKSRLIRECIRHSRVCRRYSSCWLPF